MEHKFEYQEFMNKVANVEKQQQGISGTTQAVKFSLGARG